MLGSLSVVNSLLLLSSTLLWASLIPQLTKNLPAMQEIPIRSLGSIPRKESDMTEQLSTHTQYSIVCTHVLAC